MLIQIILFWQPVDLNSLTHWMSGTASTFLELIQKTFLMELWRTQPPWKITTWVVPEKGPLNGCVCVLQNFVNKITTV